MLQRSFRAAVVVAGFVLVGAAPAYASSTLSYPVDGGPLTVVAGDPGVTVTLFQLHETGCGASCDNRLDLRSPQLFTETPDTTRCEAPAGDTGFLQCRPLPSVTEVTGSAGADSLSATGGGNVACPDPVVRFLGAGGADALQSGCADDRLDGGDGRDTLDAGGGADELHGGPEADVLQAGPGFDALHGGDGRDVLLPGTGTDVVTGGPSVDRVSYEDRVSPVIVSIGGIADDGEPGESDTVAEDVEDILGGAGADSIAGSAGANDIDAGPGADSVNPGGGPDTVEAGAGDDSISVRDGVPDRVSCGEGTDRVTADAFDALDGCELADASRELMPDVDGDGLSVAQGDCEDRDPGKRPGLQDRPGDGLDQDCVAGDTPYPRLLTAVSSGWRFYRRHLRFTKLELVDVPDRATAELRCKGKGCFKGVKRRERANGAEKLKLTKLVKRSKLRPKAVLEVRILRPDTIGKVVRYKIRKGKKSPRSRILCLRPGAKAPHGCKRA